MFFWLRQYRNYQAKTDNAASYHKAGKQTFAKKYLQGYKKYNKKQEKFAPRKCFCHRNFCVLKQSKKNKYIYCRNKRRINDKNKNRKKYG